MTVHSIEDRHWFDPQPYRIYALLLLRETGLHWRLLAAHLEVPAAAMAKLLARPAAQVHASTAAAIITASSEQILQLRAQRVPASPARALFHELCALHLDLSPWLSSRDQHHLNSTAIYLPRALHDQVVATHELAHQLLGRVTPAPPALQSV